MNEINKPAAAFFITVTISLIVFVTLKVLKIIKWSWLWVLAPLWIPYAMFIVGGIMVILYMLIFYGIERIFKRHGRLSDCQES